MSEDNDGVPRMQGKKTDSGFSAGGLNQPPIHVLAGYITIFMQDLNDSSPAPKDGELSNQFPAPQNAMNWITNVIRDQTVTTCNDPTSKSNQAGIAGRGLLPWIMSCGDQNKDYCADNIKTNLTNLVSGQTPITKENLEAVSASGIVISPQVINAIRNMNSTQQSIIVSKLSQEVSTQKIFENN